MRTKRMCVRFFPVVLAMEEENWLNRMAGEGYNLERVFFFLYFFRKGEPGGYRYRVEISEYGKNSLPGRQYRYYLRDEGIEEACRFGSWVYLRIPAGADWPDRGMDAERLLGHIRRWLWRELACAILFLVMAVIGFWNADRVWAYLTAGLLLLLSASGFWSFWKMVKRRRELEKGGHLDEDEGYAD